MRLSRLRYLTRSCFLLLVTLTTVGPFSVVDAASKPNIVLILADDLGIGDLSCLNPQSKITTPHCDRLAREGIVFTDAHSASAVCTPSRYGLLTGRYCWRSKLQSGVLGGLSPRLIEPNRRTLAQCLADQGYNTACIGKWHLGMDWTVLPGKTVQELSIEQRDQVRNVDYSAGITNGPLSLGFQHYFGISASLDMVPYGYLRDNHLTAELTQDRSFLMMAGRPNGGTTRQGPTAADFQADQVLRDLTSEAVKTIETAAKSTETPFFLYLPLASPHTPILPTKEWDGKSGLNPYADFVLQTDHAIGEILAALDRENLTQNTLVIVTSDNGCSPQAQYPELLAKGHNPSGPYRGHKADLFEGGHRIPLILRWPARITSPRTTPALVGLTDLYATIAAILEVPLAPDEAEDSLSFLPILLGETEHRRPPLVCHSINGSFAIREQRWKLLLCPGSGGWSTPRPNRDDTSHLPLVQLYDLEKDIAEQTNRQAQEPEIVSRLIRKLEDLVANGRSTPGPPQQNSVEVNIWQAGKQAHRPRISPKN